MQSCTIASFTGGWPDPSRGLCQHCILPFTQLIHQTGVEQSVLIRLPGVRDKGIEIAIVSLAWNGNVPPRYTDRGHTLPARHYVMITKTLGGLATSLSLPIADHHPSGAVFLSLFTNRDASPTCMAEEAHLHPSGWDSSLAILKPQSNVVTRPDTTSFALLQDGHVAWGRFQAEDVDPYQTRRAVRSSLLNARPVLRAKFNYYNILAL